MKYKDIEKNIKDERSHYHNGYMIIIDIKDSTKRKMNKSLWALHTNYVYSLFCAKLDELCENNQCNQLKKIIYKFTGDGGMCFIETKNISKPESNLSFTVFYKVKEIIDEVSKNEDNFEGLKIKTVLTYLTDIFYLEIDNNADNNKNSIDVVGRGIDFSFRLEKYSEPDFIIINKLFYNSIVDSIEGNKLTVIKCERYIKGWENYQTFYALFDISKNRWIDNACSNIEPNKNSDDINIEILKHKIKLSEIDLNKKNDEIKNKNKIAEIIRKFVSEEDSSKIMNELKKEELIEDLSDEFDNSIDQNIDDITKVYKGNKNE
ncbi:hypothetical protein [Brachyspira intermedia]|uniref:hypothetical protein n=1 Tax=Brachyspira intermedia TaxID=84377 RepID=UPI003006B90A